MKTKNKNSYKLLEGRKVRAPGAKKFTRQANYSNKNIRKAVQVFSKQKQVTETASQHLLDYLAESPTDVVRSAGFFDFVEKTAKNFRKTQALQGRGVSKEWIEQFFLTTAQHIRKVKELKYILGHPQNSSSSFKFQQTGLKCMPDINTTEVRFHGYVQAMLVAETQYWGDDRASARKHEHSEKIVNDIVQKANPSKLVSYFQSLLTKPKEVLTQGAKFTPHPTFTPLDKKGGSYAQAKIGQRSFLLPFLQAMKKADEESAAALAQPLVVMKNNDENAWARAQNNSLLFTNNKGSEHCIDVQSEPVTRGTHQTINSTISDLLNHYSEQYPDLTIDAMDAATRI